ncbi:MAG TPA: cytochrome c [Terriglobales bacterium]|nr:cytochrome c [Terriglobales bacterium]
MKNYQVVIVGCFLSCAFIAASGQTASLDAGLTANPVFVQNCAKCHGGNAEGRHFRGPSLLSGKVSSASEDELRNIITHGKGHMPKFSGKISSSEIDTLVQQIENLKKK